MNRSLAAGWKVAAGLSLAAIFGPGGCEPLHPAAASKSAEPPTALVTVTPPRGDDAWAAFQELARQGGPKVLMLGERRWLVVPVELRFKPVEGRKLVEATAAAHELKVAWVREGKYAILFAGASDQEVARVKGDLASADVAIRRGAAGKGGLLRDVRIVPLLLEAARDAEAEVAEQAVVSLRRMGWDVVVAMEQSALDLLGAELKSHDDRVRREAACALGRVGGEKALALLGEALADQDSFVRRDVVTALGSVGGETPAVADRALVLIEKALADQCVRHEAVYALGCVGGEKALALLEKTLADQDNFVRRLAISALGNMGGEKALALLEKALTDQDPDVRRGAACALGRVGGEKALALIEEAIDSEDADLRCGAAGALGVMSGEKALLLLEKALSSQDAEVRRGAASGLGNIGGEKALALLAKALADQDAGVRNQAVYTLGSVGGEKVLVPLEKALSDHEADVRCEAAYALGRVGGGKARELLLKQLTEENDGTVLRSLVSSLRRYAGDPAVEKALKEAEARLPKE